MRRKTVSLRKWLPCYVGLVGCLLAAATAVLALYGGKLHDRLLASYYECQLAEADETSRQTLKRLMALGRPGITVVVRALGAPTPATREEAYHTLIDEFDRCEQLSAQAALGPRLADVASVLADHLHDVPAAERQRAGALVMKIVALSEAVPLAERAGVMDACRQILEPREEKRVAMRSLSMAPLRMAPTLRARTAAKSPPPVTDSHHKTSAQIELAYFSPPALSRADRQAPAEPALLLTGNAVALAGRAEKPRPAENRRPVQVAAFTDNTPESRAEEAARLAREKAHALDVIELFNHLHAGRPQATAARAELDRRGFSPRQIDVGEHLVSPDAAERLQWIEWLPGIRGVDARFWLLRLSHDPNPHVRRAAVGLLATDRDPEVVRRLQRVVVEDPDERIRNQASRAVEMLGEP
jgi:hypothetical protein